MERKALFGRGSSLLISSPALGFVNNASASDGSSIHSTLQQDHMLTPWALDMQKEASR